MELKSDFLVCLRPPNQLNHLFLAKRKGASPNLTNRFPRFSARDAKALGVVLPKLFATAEAVSQGNHILQVTSPPKSQNCRWQFLQILSPYGVAPDSISGHVVCVPTLCRASSFGCSEYPEILSAPHRLTFAHTTAAVALTTAGRKLKIFGAYD
jgi:hypothetical protein